MNFRFCKILLFVFICFTYLSCSDKQPSIEQVIIVKIMPLPIWDEASKEFYYWEKQKFLFPQIEIPHPLPKGIPNDDSLLVVSVGKDGKIKLNEQVTADLSNIEPLRTKLESLFSEREKANAFEPHSEKIVKITAVRASIRLKYGEVLKIIELIKTSGADPIILQIDDAPE